MAATRVGFRTDVGCRRALNEDSLFVGHKVWAVADGMGGHAAGEVASALVVERLRQLDEVENIEPVKIIECIRQANDDLLQHGRQNPEASGLGTTVSGVCEVSVGGTPHWAIFNVGDSRVYRFLDDELTRATIDHSETEELVLQGLITQAEARHHHLRNVITRSIGVRPAPQVDMWVVPQSGGERFLICSDGLTSELEDDSVSSVLKSCTDPQAAADLLIDETLRAGARDNVTIIVLDVHGESAVIDEQTNPRPEF